MITLGWYLIRSCLIPVLIRDCWGDSCTSLTLGRILLLQFKVSANLCILLKCLIWQPLWGWLDMLNILLVLGSLYPQQVMIIFMPSMVLTGALAPILKGRLLVAWSNLGLLWFPESRRNSPLSLAVLPRLSTRVSPQRLWRLFGWLVYTRSWMSPFTCLFLFLVIANLCFK